MDLKMIMALVADEKTDTVLEAAREAGATGATVITSVRGEGLEPVKTFLGLEVASQRDILLFLVAAPLALKLGCGFTMVRKKGKLPGKTVSYEYELEYGSDIIEIQEDAVAPGQRVVVLDDLLATGGTLGASIHLFQKVGAEVVGTACIVELDFLNGRDKLNGVPFDALVTYSD